VVDRDAHDEALVVALNASSAAFIFIIGFIALVRTSTRKPRDRQSSSICGSSRFMSGSPPVKPISLVGRPSRAISSRYSRTSAAVR
jgi:hypothetical protein